MIREGFAVVTSRYYTHAAVPMVTEEAVRENDLEDFIYAKGQNINNGDGEIVKYLGEDLADSIVDSLGYRHRRRVDFPSLSKMARALLAIFCY